MLATPDSHGKIRGFEVEKLKNHFQTKEKKGYNAHIDPSFFNPSLMDFNVSNKNWEILKIPIPNLMQEPIFIGVNTLQKIIHYYESVYQSQELFSRIQIVKGLEIQMGIFDYYFNHSCIQ